jgi:hypothetical protein
VYFPDGIGFNGKRLVGNDTTLPVLTYLNPVSEAEKDLVDQTTSNWNSLEEWVRRIETLRTTLPNRGFPPQNPLINGPVGNTKQLPNF